MTGAREIVAKAIDGLFAGPSSFSSRFAARKASEEIERALTSAGFRILGPDEIDGPTVEKCAEVADAVVKDHQGPFTSQPAYVAACSIRDAIRALKEKRT